MTCSTRQCVDPEIANLSGGLFENAHLMASVEGAPGPGLPPELPARVRAPRRARWVVGAVVAALLLAAGFAEAMQAPRAPVAACACPR